VRRLLVLALAGLLLAACGGGKDNGNEDALSPQAARGKRLVEEKGCLSCHTTDGSKGTGPTWKGLAGSQVKLTDGTTVTADADYLRRSILDPDAQTVAGFPPGLMAATIRPGTVSEEEAAAIVAYLQTL
jgi:mono/diheme cytochrome c family protein